MQADISTRTTITNGVRPLRYLFGTIGLFLFASFLGTYSEITLILLLACILLTFLFYRSRKIQFDESNLYRVYPNKEKTVSFSDITSIKRSNIKVNGTRLWKVTYRDKDQLEQKMLFKEGTFQHGSTNELIEAVKDVNPSVVIWGHPHFNQPE